MNTPHPSSAPETPASTAWQQTSDDPRGSLGLLVSGSLGAFARLILGMIFCQTALTSVAVVGWLQRAMQRSALKAWWRMRAKDAHPHANDSFSSWARENHRTAAHETWPRWILWQSPRNGPPGSVPAKGWSRVRAVFRLIGHSAWLNLVLGVQGLFSTAILTLPAGLLWLFAWYDGWNNSFNKGYEQAAVGPVVWGIGAVVFVAAMFYVPLAQARQAVTGDWRTFFDFRIIRAVHRERWFAILGLAALYAVLAVPVNVFKTLPGFFPQMNATFDAMSSEEARDFLRRYFLGCAAYFFPALVLLRLMATRIYAAGLLSAVRRGALLEESLGEFEWEAMHRLGLLEHRNQPKRARWVQIAAWFGTRMGRVTACSLVALVWLAFVIQVLVAEFFTYHPGVGWLNQPLIQLPWFRYLPTLP